MRLRWAAALLVWLCSGLDTLVVADEAPSSAPELGQASSAIVKTPALQRGINITAWFRFPASREPAALATYITNQALADLRVAGFDFVRLAVDPSVVNSVAQRSVLVAAIRAIEHQGLTVIVSPHPHDWRLETNTADRESLLAFWRSLAPALKPLDSVRTVPEVLNEPVFPGDPAGWARLQHLALREIRQALPHATVVLTGQDWGSIGGLIAITPEEDPNVVYSFHLYDPVELTSLAAYRSDVDRTALAQLPFPVSDRPACEATAAFTADVATRGLILYYCALGWDAARVDATVDRAASWARDHRVRLLAGEFGATADLNPAARIAWLKTVRGAFETQGIGWALWGYDDVMGLAVSRPPEPRPRLDQAVLTALGLTTRM